MQMRQTNSKQKLLCDSKIKVFLTRNSKPENLKLPLRETSLH